MENPLYNKWPENPDILHLARRTNRCAVLGPGVRAVFWVQGCPHRCLNCVAPEMQPFHGGEDVQVQSLVQEIACLPDIEGVTLSGGEPMSQAVALCNLIDQVRMHQDLSFICYTGFYKEYLLDQGDSWQKALLKRLDILIDGPYLQERHTDLRWRGSDNQRVHLLSDRHADLAAILNDHGLWLEFEVAQDGEVRWMGIPPHGFPQVFPSLLKTLGIELSVKPQEEAIYQRTNDPREEPGDEQFTKI